MARKRRDYIGERYPILAPRGISIIPGERIGPWWDWFKGYLESAIWYRVRQRVISAAKGICEVCQQVKATDAHHLTYVRAGHERWGDLQAVCTTCHQEIHGRVW